MGTWTASVSRRQGSGPWLLVLLSFCCSPACRWCCTIIPQGLADLAQLVFTRAAPKTFRGVTLTGPLLISMLQGALQVANTPGGVLNIGSMWNSMLEAELARAAAAARKAYDKAARTMAACSSAEQAERMHKVRWAAEQGGAGGTQPAMPVSAIIGGHGRGAT